MVELMTEAELTEIEARAEKATPGPWHWWCRPNVRSICLESAKWLVMGFARWGMQGAIPMFKDKDMSLTKATQFMEIEPGREHHAEWHRLLKHPDAEFISHSRTDIPKLCAEVRRLQAENERLRGLAVGPYAEECPSEVGFYLALNPNPDDDPVTPCEIYSKGTPIQDLTASAAFAEGWRFSRIPTPEDSKC